jgi:hypothetical protein
MNNLLIEEMEFIDALEESGGVRSYLRRHTNSAHYKTLVSEVRNEISHAQTKSELNKIKHEITEYIHEIQHRLPKGLSRSLKGGLIAGTVLPAAAGPVGIALAGASILINNSNYTTVELKKYLQDFEKLLFQVNAKILQFKSRKS